MARIVSAAGSRPPSPARPPPRPGQHQVVDPEAVARRSRVASRADKAEHVVAGCKVEPPDEVVGADVGLVVVGVDLVAEHGRARFVLDFRRDGRLTVEQGPVVAVVEAVGGLDGELVAA